MQMNGTVMMQRNATVTNGSTVVTPYTNNVVKTALDTSISVMQQSAEAGDMVQHMMELLKLMLMIAAKLRDARQQLTEQQSTVTLEKTKRGLETALEGVQMQTYANYIKAGAEIVSGGLSVLGIYKSVFEQDEAKKAMWSAGGSAAGKASEGIGGVLSAYLTHKGQILSNRSEFQKTVAESNRQVLADLQSKMEEAMREVLSTARDLSEKISGLIQAVKLH